MPGIVALTVLVAFLFVRLTFFAYFNFISDKLIHCHCALTQISSNTDKLCAWSDGHFRVTHRIQLFSLASLLLHIQRCVSAIAQQHGSITFFNINEFGETLQFQVMKPMKLLVFLHSGAIGSGSMCGIEYVIIVL